jgi:hypothetical protein
VLCLALPYVSLSSLVRSSKADDGKDSSKQVRIAHKMHPKNNESFALERTSDNETESSELEEDNEAVSSELEKVIEQRPKKRQRVTQAASRIVHQVDTSADIDSEAEAINLILSFRKPANTSKVPTIETQSRDVETMSDHPSIRKSEHTTNRNTGNVRRTEIDRQQPVATKSRKTPPRRNMIAVDRTKKASNMETTKNMPDHHRLAPARKVILIKENKKRATKKHVFKEACTLEKISRKYKRCIQTRKTLWANHLLSSERIGTGR